MYFIYVYIAVVCICILESYLTTRYDNEFEHEIKKKKDEYKSTD